MVIGRGSFLGLFDEIHTREVICNSFPKFRLRHFGFSFYGLRKSDEGADADLIYDCCWPNYLPLYIVGAVCY